ncbi:MAG: endonuclease domain-containing protein [Sphingomonadales bacterium]|nr:MAG: endonuclease domain-containing protein [Sphingomonadales bacterium]
MRLYQNQPSGAVDQLRSFRRNATEAEKVLLRALREKLPQHKWRFQVPVGPFRVDLMCFAERLAVEVDGGQHDAAAEYDARRTRFIEDEGYRVLRFWNNDVLGNADGVVAVIANSLSHREREGARRVSGGKGEGDVSHLTHPHPSGASRLPPSPDGRGKEGAET